MKLFNIFRFKNKRKNNFQLSSESGAGFIFLEILISTALISVVFITLMGIGVLSLNISSSMQKTTLIDSLIKEEIEAVRSFRDATLWATTGLGSSSVVVNGNSYYFNLDNTVNPPKWKINSGTETIDDFTRSVIFDKVFRDSNGNIVTVGGTEDLDTKKVTVSVIFGSRTYQVVTYLTNWQNK